MIERLCTWLLGGLFVIAGCMKWQDVAGFQKAVRSFQLLPTGLSDWVAVWLPAFEILCGVLLLVGVLKRPALLGCVVLGCLFVMALGWGIARGTLGSCGCFGAWDPLANRPWLSLLRAGLFLAMAAWLYWRELIAPNS